MKTVDRILLASLDLLNEQGVAKVSTNAIADVADLSVGNLYYHFKNKDNILLALIEQFQTLIEPLLDTELNDCTLDEWTQWWYSWFEGVQKYSFLFHDQSYLLHRNEHIRYRYDHLIKRVETKQKLIFENLKLQGYLVATKGDIIRLSREVTFIAVFWQDFYDLRHGYQANIQSPYASALEQILGLILPYLKAPEQLRVEQLMKAC